MFPENPIQIIRDASMRDCDRLNVSVIYTLPFIQFQRNHINLQKHFLLVWSATDNLDSVSGSFIFNASLEESKFSLYVLFAWHFEFPIRNILKEIHM